MGTPLKEIVHTLGQGFKEPVKALHIGGPLGGIVPVSKIDELTLDFESFNEIPYVGALPLENEIFLGNDIASRLGIRTGDIVKISSPLYKRFILGFPPTLEVKVSGIFSSKILNYDNHRGFAMDSRTTVAL